MILITGAAGFLGSNLCHYLYNNGYQDVIMLDAMVRGSNRDNLKGLPYPLTQINLRDTSLLEQLFENNKITKVIHLAAESHVDNSLCDAGDFWRTNVQGTYNLLNVAYKARTVEVFINQITDEVYGPTSKTRLAKEYDAFNPTSPYACSKAAQYFVGKSFYETYKFPVISTFPSNCFGPRQAPEKLIPKFITKLLRGEKVPLMKSTHYQRDWLPAEDLSSALVLLLDKGRPGKSYNIGADNHRTNMELTKELLVLCNRDESYIEIVPDRLAHDSNYAISSEQIKQLDWEIKNTFEDYLVLTVNWYKENYVKAI